MTIASLSKHQRLWQHLRKHTEARIGLGRSGGSMTTEHHLAFQYAHACAQDAVWRPLDWAAVASGLSGSTFERVDITSQAQNRDQYLQRPDLGRQLSKQSQQTLMGLNKQHSDVVIVIADGLSSTAIEHNAIKMVACLLTTFSEHALACPYICFAKQARVALGDSIAELLNAKHLVLLVGERPGLSSPNSLGIYYTYGAKAGYTDEKRNCISNIRDGGQSIEMAAERLIWLINEAARRQLSGVNLKDDSQSSTMQLPQNTQNILLP